MKLSMTVLRCPDQVAPEARTVSGGEFHVGRGPDVDWVLPDPDRLLSKRHFAVAFRGGSWQVADTSTNGTYLNTEADSIGRGTPRSLRDGDRLRLGAYEIEIRLAEQPAQGDAIGGFGGSSAGSGVHPGQSPFGDPFAEDLLAPSPAPRRPFDEPAYRDLGMAPTNAQLPHDFDPLAPEENADFDGGFRGPVQADHSSSMSDAMTPPPIAEYSTPNTGGIIPGDDLLPDDWDKDLLEGIAPPSQTPAPVPMQVAPHPIAAVPLAAPAVSPPPGMPRSGATFSEPSLDSSPFGTPPPGTARPMAATPEPMDFTDPLDFTDPPAVPEIAPRPVISAPPPIAAPVAPPVVRPATPAAAAMDADPFGEPRPARPLSAPLADLAASPFDEPSDPLRSVPEPSVRPPAANPARPVQIPAAADDGGALAAFFKGADLTGATPTDPIAMMTGLGQAFRAVVAGLRAVLIARATIKSEFRIEQTMIRARGNNPLKFSANDDDALTALLGVGRRTDMTPAAAVEDSLRDLRLHELAVMAAMQVAVRAMLNELSPDKIRAGSDRGGMAVLPAQRKARAWDAFEARHASVAQALMDDFDGVFGKNFARAYERALDEISMRERQ